IYSLSEAEGIIKVSGEVGSGKTMLCRMLIERLPKHIETVYLANPSLSREELLYAIADALELNFDSERVGIIMQSIQNKLLEKARQGKRIVVLVDEAHAMPLDTLEELRLLYNLQVGNFKLLQIILFGQPELNAKLDQPNMRQLKDRIVHHFHMQPLSRNILENYLMFRMRAAGYRGPNIFSPDAVKLIAKASNGLMRRANVLADKSLLAAFVADTHNIEVSHVKAAMRDSELNIPRSVSGKQLMLSGSVAAALLGSMVAWWLWDSPATHFQQANGSIKQPAQMASAQNPSPDTTAQTPPAYLPQTTASTSNSKPQANREDMAATPPGSNNAQANGRTSLFEQRLAAGRQLLEQKKAVASIQLFYNEDIQKPRIEGFLKRADGLGKLSEIYLLPTKSSGQNGLRVLYGAYPSVDMARNAIKDLPARYQQAFTASVYIF
ncbi:MAG: AAA family ATPase, partial [Nitrosomonadales bacterium]|nr:AAA family ATPase [Nitrosomonadales bacterium]